MEIRREKALSIGFSLFFPSPPHALIAAARLHYRGISACGLGTGAFSVERGRALACSAASQLLLPSQLLKDVQVLLND